ncbi:MAG TPA: hypothetical protein VGA89_03725, partial [Patescibacteria group bacterium]
ALILVLAIVGPLLLFFVELLMPWPHLIEELFKLAGVWLIVDLEKKDRHSHWLTVVLFAALFTLSESMFYLINIFSVGKFSNFSLRLIYTFILHLGTTYLLYFGWKKKPWGLLAFILAVVIHYLYNSWV